MNKTQDSLLIKADVLLLGEGLQQIKFPAPPGWPPGEWFDIGNLDKDRTKVLRMKGYPMNRLHQPLPAERRRRGGDRCALQYHPDAPQPHPAPGERLPTAL
jgi:hypothetical protein